MTRTYEEMKAEGGKAFEQAEQDYLEYRSELQQFRTAGKYPQDGSTRITRRGKVEVHDGYVRTTGSQGESITPVLYGEGFKEDAALTAEYETTKDKGNNAKSAMEKSVPGLTDEEKVTLANGRRNVHDQHSTNGQVLSLLKTKSSEHSANPALTRGHSERVIQAERTDSAATLATNDGLYAEDHSNTADLNPASTPKPALDRSNATLRESSQTHINESRLKGFLFNKGLNKDLENANQAVEDAKEGPSFGTRAMNFVGAGYSKVASMWKGSRKAEMDHLKATEGRSQAEIAAAEVKRDAVAVKKAGVEASQGYIDTRQDLRTETEQALRGLLDDKKLSENERNRERLAILNEHELAKKQLEKSRNAALKSTLDDISVQRNPQLDKCSTYEEAAREMQKPNGKAFELAEETKGKDSTVQVLDDPRYPKDQSRSPYKDLPLGAYNKAREEHQLTLTIDNKTGKVTEAKAGEKASFTMLCNGQMITKRGEQVEAKFGEKESTPKITISGNTEPSIVKHTPEKSAAGLQSLLEKRASSTSGVDSGVSAKPAPAKVASVHQ